MDAEVDKTSQKQASWSHLQQMKLNSQPNSYDQTKNSYGIEGNQSQEDEPIQQSSHNEQILLSQELDDKHEDDLQQKLRAAYNNQEMSMESDEEVDNFKDNSDPQRIDINQLSEEYYLQSNRDAAKKIDASQIGNNNFNMRGSLFYSPRDIQSQIQYQYSIPSRIKTEGNDDDFSGYFNNNNQSNNINHSFHPQSPQHFTLGQLNSKSFFINTIMKKDSRELLEQQKELMAQIEQVGVAQKAKQQDNNKQKKVVNRQMNQQSFDSYKFQNNFLDSQAQNLRNQLQQKRGQLMSNQNPRKQNGSSLGQKRQISSQQLIDETHQPVKSQNIVYRKPSVLNQLIPIQETQSTKANTNPTAKFFQNKQGQNSSTHISPQNELKNQGENIIYFKKVNQKQQSAKTRLPEVSKSLSLTSNQQMALKKSLAQHQLSGILNQQSSSQTTLNQNQSVNPLTQTSNSTVGTLNSFQSRIPNKQNYILIGNKTKQSSTSNSSINKFSKTSYTEGSFGKSSQSRQQLKLPNFVNNIDTEGRETDEENEEIGEKQQQNYIQQDIYGQKFIQRIDGIIQESDSKNQKFNKNNTFANKSFHTTLGNQLETIPPQGILTSAKPIESISFYYLNKNPNQTDLISERTNLNAPPDPHLKLNQFDDGKWKIEKSDNMDLEASRSQSSLSPNKHIFGKQSSQQLSPNTFFPQNSDKRDNSPPLFNMLDNSNISTPFLELNKTSPFQKQRSSSDDSQTKKEKQSTTKLDQRKNSHDVPTILIDNKLQGDQSQTQIPRKFTGQSQSSSKSLLPQNDQMEQKLINRQASSSISLQVTQQNNMISEAQLEKDANSSSPQIMKVGSFQQSSTSIPSQKNQQTIKQQQSNSIKQQEVAPQKQQAQQQSQLQQLSQQTDKDDQKLQQNLQSQQPQPKSINNKITKKDKEIQQNQNINSADGDNNQSSDSDDSCQSKSSSKESNKASQKSRESCTQPRKTSPSQSILQQVLNQSSNNSNNLKSQNSSGMSLRHIPTSRDSISEEKNLLNPSLIIQQQIENPFLLEDSSLHKEVLARSMTTVYEKSEITSNRSIPLHESDYVNQKRKSSTISQSDQQQILNKISEVHQLKRKSINADQATLLKQLNSSSKSQIGSSSLTKIKDIEEIKSKQSLDDNINNNSNNGSVTKKRSLSDQDKPIQTEEDPLKIDFSKIGQMQSEKQIKSNRLQVIQDEERMREQQLRTRSETFKGKQDDELQINVVPPDNSTPQAIKNSQLSQFNFSELSTENQNIPTIKNKSLFGQSQQNNEKSNPEIITSVQQISNSISNNNNNNNMSPQHNSVNYFMSSTSMNNTSLTAINTNAINSNYGASNSNSGIPLSIVNSHQNGSTSTLNQEELSQGGSKRNIPQISPLLQFQQQQQQLEKDNYNAAKRQSQQQLNIQNHSIYQKLSRSVKSSEDSYVPHQFGVDIEPNLKGEQYSLTTKHSFKKGYGNENSVSNFSEQDSPATSFKRQAMSKPSVNTKVISSNNSLQHEDIQKISKRPSFDGSNSRRSSVLTPQQIKQVKKESRFYNKINFQNKSFFDSEDPVLMNIYGQENDKYVELNGICSFNDSSPKQKSFFKIDDDMIMNTLLEENEDRYSNQLTQAQLRDVNFKKLIYQIDHVKQNPYSETFDQAKVDNIFQKNVKTLFRKINQYFKTKYHYDASNVEGQRVVSKQQQAQDNSLLKNKIPKVGQTKGFGFTADKQQQLKDKKSIQTDLAQSDEIEYDENKTIGENIELKKSDIEKLNQKLSQSNKSGMIEKLIINKIDDPIQSIQSQKDTNQGIDKQSTLDRINGILRNSKKRQSHKLVIQINPPADEPTQIQIPHIKLDFSAIKKKNGNTEFVLDPNANQETESLQSSDEDGDDNEDDRNIDGFPKYFVMAQEQKIDSFKNFDFLNNSQDSWDGNLFNSQGIDGNPLSQKGFYKNQAQNFEIQNRKQSLGRNKQSMSKEVEDFKLTTLNFLNQNSWRFVKNYQITYLEKQIDKGFLLKVQRLPEFLKNLKNKVDPTDCFKLESFIQPIYNNFYGGEVFLNREGRSKTLQHIPSQTEIKDNESIDLKLISIYEHIFQKDLVNDCYLDEKKRQNEECTSSEESDSMEDSIESSEDDEDLEIDTYNLLGDQDKDLSDKNWFFYDEEDYEVARSNYLLNKGYLEPTIINESSNMFPQLYEQIVPVLSGIDNEYINEILKTRGKSDKKAMLEIKQQSQIEKKYKTINKMISHLDFRSSQTDMKNIQSEYNELLEGDFQDNQKIDHDFYKKEFIKLQHQQFNKFLTHQRNQRRKQLTVIPKKPNADNSVIGNASVTLPQYQKQQIKERSPKSIPDLYEAATTKYKSQDSKSSQYQTFQHSINQYNQQQQQQSGLSTQAGSLQQQQQLQIQQQQQSYQQSQQQQQHYQQIQFQHQSHTLQQNPAHIHSFLQQNTLPSHTIQYNIISPSNQLSSAQRIPNPQTEVTIAAPPHLKNLQNKGFTQSLKNFNVNQGNGGNTNTNTLQYISGLPQKTEPTLRSQMTIKNDDDHTNVAKNAQKILKQKISLLKRNTPQSYKSDVHQTTAMQSGYNKTSTLQSQQSIFNQSESLHNRDAGQMISQDNSKQAVKVSESQFMLQKTNTTHSADENQLTAPSPTQISKKDIRATGRKRSIFNTDNMQNIQQQQFLHQDLNRSHHSPPSLHSPNFPYHNQGGHNIPQLLSNKSNSVKSLNFYQQSQNNGIHSPILPQSQLQHQVSILNNVRQSISFNQSNLGQSNLNSFYSNQQNQQNQILTQQSPQQQLQPIEIPQTPIRSPNRGGTIISHALMHNLNNLSTINQITSAQQINNQLSGIQNIYPQSTIGSLGFPNSTQTTSQGQVNLPSTPSNLNPSNQTIQLQNNSTKQYSNQLQLETQDSKQMRSNRTFSSLTVKRELEKSTSMDRQNLVMRTRLQQNLRRSQLDQKDQVFAAIKENNIHEIEDLLNQYHSLSLESKDEEGNTFIIVAAQVGSKEIVEYLFQKGADINAQNNDGDSALHKANFYQYHTVADFLIQNGAQQNKMNNFGLNPWGCYPSTSKR